MKSQATGCGSLLSGQPSETCPTSPARATPTRMHPRFELAQVDAVAWLRSLPPSSVDLLITDPAYESLEKHRAVGTTTRLKHSKASSNDWFAIFPNSRFPDLFEAAYRVLKKNAHLYMFCDKSQRRGPHPRPLRPRRNGAGEVSRHGPHAGKKVWWHGYGESFRRQMEGFLDMQFAQDGEAVTRGPASCRHGPAQATVTCSTVET